MNIIIHSPTCQEFNGERYYLSAGKPYFQRVIGRTESQLLHRTVWAYHNGMIRTGYHVHHIDGNPANNALENLQLMQAGEHLSRHMTPERREWASGNIVRACVPAAKAWHKSERGRAWHSRQAKVNVRRRLAEPRQFVCQACGKSFEAKCLQPAKYCSPQCNWRAQGRKKRARKLLK